RDFFVMRYDADGSLDTTFGTQGFVITAFNGSQNNSVGGLALQADGKIVVVGQSQQGGNYDFALVRYTAGGNLDTAFCTGGEVLTSFAPSTDASPVAWPFNPMGPSWSPVAPVPTTNLPWPVTTATAVSIQVLEVAVRCSLNSAPRQGV